MFQINKKEVQLHWLNFQSLVRVNLLVYIQKHTHINMERTVFSLDKGWRSQQELESEGGMSKGYLLHLFNRKIWFLQYLHSCQFSSCKLLLTSFVWDYFCFVMFSGIILYIKASGRQGGKTYSKLMDLRNNLHDRYLIFDGTTKNAQRHLVEGRR